MTGDELRRVILRVLGEIAPEADLSVLKPDVSLRDQLDLDSMDVLNFVIGLHETLRVDIPEADYPQLLTVNGAMQYLAAALDSPHPT
jgi:acyl carrier protein